MKTELLTRARKHFASDFISREANRAHIRKWVRMVRWLGNRWLMVKPMERNPQAMTTLLILFALFVVLAAVAVFVVGMIVFEWYLPPDEQAKKDVERLIAAANKPPRKRAF